MVGGEVDASLYLFQCDSSWTCSRWCACIITGWRWNSRRTQLIEGCFQKLFTQVKQVGLGVDRKRGGGAEVTRSTLSLSKRLTTERKRQWYCCISNPTLFGSRWFSCQCEGSSRPNTSSLTWPVSQHSECGWQSWSELLLSIHWFTRQQKKGLHS